MSQKNQITENLRNAGYTQKAWCKQHRANIQYMRMICAGTRGVNNIGECKRIRDLLKAGGFWVDPNDQKTKQGENK